MAFDTDYTDGPVCPYCGYEHELSYEEPEGEIECANCDETFRYESEVSVSYSTSCMVHEYGDVQSSKKSGTMFRSCNRCGALELVDEDR